MSNNISLIYPSEHSYNGKLLISNDDFKALLGNYLYCRDFDITEFMTGDVDTIKYRQEIFSDILNEPRVLDLLKEILPMLENIDELYRLRENSHEIEGQIYSIKLIEIYIEFINTIQGKANAFLERIKSRSLLNFAQSIYSIAESDEFKSLVVNTRKLSKDISQVKSVTIGMNLDASFSPCEFGVLSLNSEYIVSKGFVERLVSSNDKGPLTAIAPLKVISKSLSKGEKRFADMAVGATLSRLYKSAIKDWEPLIKAFFRQKTQLFLPLIKEIKYLIFGAQILNELKENKLPLSMPEIKPKSDGVFDVKGIYNPLIALRSDKIVYNDICFDENGKLYLLLGPNSGGKSVFTIAVGICQIFAQLGFLVPAKQAIISPLDKIFICFTDKSNSKDKGRLEEECAKIKAIFKELTENSLVLLDETFSSTNAIEGKYIAVDVLKGMSACGCRALFSTHFYDIIQMIDEINEEERSKSKVDVLSACIDDNGNRNYKILRSLPNGDSYARGIAEKYGLSYERLIADII